MQITRKLVISSTLWAAVTQGAVMLINLLVLPLFIQNLGAELYGIWILSGVVLGYAGVFDFGFTQGLQKYVAEARVKKDDQELSEVVVTGLGLLSIVGFILGVLIYFGAPAIVGFFNIEEGQNALALQLLQISALFSVITWPLRIVDVVLNASMRIKELSLLNGVKSVVQSVIMLLLLIINSAGIIQIKWVTASVAFLLSLYGIILLRKYVPQICWYIGNFKFKQILRMQRFSFGMFYGSIVLMFSIQVDTVIIAKFLTMEAVTAYAIAAKPFMMIRSVIGLLLGAINPATYNLKALSDYGRIETLISVGVRVRCLVAIPSCVIAFICVQDFIYLWVGGGYTEYAIWSRCFLLVPVLACLGVGANVCKAVGEVGLVNSISTMKVLLNLIISLLLVKSLGIGGVILGTVICNIIFGDVFLFGLYCRRSGVSPRQGYRHFFRILFVSFFMGILGFYVCAALDFSGLLGLLMKASIIGCLQLCGLFFWCMPRDEKKRALVFLKTLNL